MNKSVYIVSLRFWAITILTGVLITSCGARRKTVSSLPRHTSEITLEQLLDGTARQGDAAPLMSDKARILVEEAQRWIGTPYKYGGETRNGIDCSALVMNVYRDALGMKLPRNSAKQREYASTVSRDKLMPGDLVFFSSTKNRSGISHVGMYIGNNRFIHASSSRGVVVSQLSETYFMTHYHSSGRVLNQSDLAVSQASGTTSLTDADNMRMLQADLLEAMLNATIDSIYSMPVDDDPNLAPGL